MADDEDYVYDEDSGEWLPASELAAKRAPQPPETAPPAPQAAKPKGKGRKAAGAAT